MATFAGIKSEATKITNQRTLSSIRRAEFDAFSADDDSKSDLLMACAEAYATHMVKNLGFSSKDVDYLNT